MASPCSSASCATTTTASRCASLDYSAHPSGRRGPAGRLRARWPPGTRSPGSVRSTGWGTSTSATSPWWPPSPPPHRGEAFEACRDLIDTLKATVPIWKHQQFTDGSRRVGGAAVSTTQCPRRPQAARRPGRADPTRPRSACRRPSLVALFLLIALGALSTMVGLPYVVIKPGPDHQHPRHARRGPAHHRVGREDLPDRRCARLHDRPDRRRPGRPRITVWDLLRAADEPQRGGRAGGGLLPQGGRPPSRSRRRAPPRWWTPSRRPSRSRSRPLGEKVTEQVVIARVADDAPSKDLLEAGDVIVSVDGTTVADSAAIRTAVGAHTPGETVAARPGPRRQARRRSRPRPARPTAGPRSASSSASPSSSRTT